MYFYDNRYWFCPNNKKRNIKIKKMSANTDEILKLHVVLHKLMCSRKLIKAQIKSNFDIFYI